MDQLTSFEYERIIQSAKDGDMDALYFLFSKAHVAGMAIAAGIVKSRAEAEDVCQDAFMRIMKNMDSASTVWPRFRAWMLMIVKNEAIDHQRKLKRLMPIDEWVESGDSSQNRQGELDRAEEQAFNLVQHYKGKLVPMLKRQQPLIMREISVRVEGGVEFQTACQIVAGIVPSSKKEGSTPGAVQAEWFRIYRMLKAILEEDKVRLEAAKLLMLLIGKEL